MIQALVINDDQVLCQKTATDWLPFALALADIDDLSGQDAYARLGLVALDPSLTTSSAMTTITAAVSLDFISAHDIVCPDVDADHNPLKWIGFRQLITYLPALECQRLSAAIQLLRWQAQTRYCNRCAAALRPHASGERAMVCPNCQLAHYPRLQPCIITLITRVNPVSGRKQILLAHHHRYGSATIDPLYGLIAGFVEVGESLEQAVHREVLEEVNISIDNLRYLGSQPWPYPANLMIGFSAEYLAGINASDTILVQASELSHAKFFDIDDLPKIPIKGSIAYDMIQQVIDDNIAIPNP